MRIKKLQEALQDSGVLKTILLGYLDDLDVIKRFDKTDKYPAFCAILPEPFIVNRSEPLAYERFQLTCYAGINWVKNVDDKLTKYDELISSIVGFLQQFDTISYVSIVNPDRIKLTYLDEASVDFALFVKFTIEIKFYNGVLPPYPATTIIGQDKAKVGDIKTYTIPSIQLATSYSWTLPANVTGTSITNSINLTFGSGFNGGVLKVKGVNTYGNGKESQITINLEV